MTALPLAELLQLLAPGTAHGRPFMYDCLLLHESGCVGQAEQASGYMRFLRFACLRVVAHGPCRGKNPEEGGE